LPIHCIYFDGWSFEFFKYKKRPNPNFLRGSFHGDPLHLQRGLQVSDFGKTKTTLPFILQLRWICETIFDMTLSAYITGLNAYYDQTEERFKGPSSVRWDQARQSADHALVAFRETEEEREKGDIDSADATADKALLALQERFLFPFVCMPTCLIYYPLGLSTGAVPGPTIYRPKLIMTDWDEVEIKKR
jgi:hypothetical protein